jgi:hypothetical protein
VKVGKSPDFYGLTKAGVELKDKIKKQNKKWVRVSIALIKHSAADRGSLPPNFRPINVGHPKTLSAGVYIIQYFYVFVPEKTAPKYGCVVVCTSAQRRISSDVVYCTLVTVQIYILSSLNFKSVIWNEFPRADESISVHHLLGWRVGGEVDENLC